MTPRESFQKSPHGEKWKSLVNSDMWESAKNAALLTMVGLNHSPTKELSGDQIAAAKTRELDGALFFIRQLENLTSLPIPAQKREGGKLETV